MKTTMTINADGTVIIPIMTVRGTVGMEVEFPPTSHGAEGLWQFACHNELQMGSIVSEDTMEITLKDHPPRR